MARKKKREYVRIPVLLRGTVRLPVPEGLTAREVQAWVDKQGGVWLDIDTPQDVQRLMDGIALNFFTDAVTDAIAPKREATPESVLA